MEMKAAGNFWGDIAEALGRSRSKCQAMYYAEKRKLAEEPAQDVEPQETSPPGEADAPRPQEAAGAA